jgi:hypothetical protein
MIDLRTWLGRRLAPPSTWPRCASVGLRTASASGDLARSRAAAGQRATEPRPCAAANGAWRPGRVTGSDECLCPAPPRPGSSSPPRPLPSDDPRRGSCLRSVPRPTCPNSTSSPPKWRRASPRSRHEWGLGGEKTGSPTLQHRPDNCRRDGDPPLGREQASEGDGCLATGRLAGATERRPTRRPARWSRTRTGRAIRTAPNPGTSWRRQARSEREAGRALGRRANGTGALVKAAEVRGACPRRMAEGECCQPPRTRAERREGR